MHRARFKIPDMPPDRPKVPDVRVAVYLARPGNAAGGNCHIVLDDHNLKNDHIRWALDHCIARDDEGGAEIMRLMLRMTPSQRRRVTRHSITRTDDHDVRDPR